MQEVDCFTDQGKKFTEGGECMSATLSPEEIDSITKSRQLRRQLEELRLSGFWRVRLGRAGIVLERAHYEAVCAGALPAVQVSGNTVRPKIQPIGNKA